MLKRPLSLVALMVRVMAKGVISTMASQEPEKADIVLSSAMFFPKVLVKK